MENWLVANLDWMGAGLLFLICLVLGLLVFFKGLEILRLRRYKQRLFEQLTDFYERHKDQ